MGEGVEQRERRMRSEGRETKAEEERKEVQEKLKGRL